MEVFRRDVRQSRKMNFLEFLAPGGHNFGPGKKMTEIVSTAVLMSSQLFFPCLSSTLSYHVRGGSKRPPPTQAKVELTPTQVQVKET